MRLRRYRALAQFTPTQDEARSSLEAALDRLARRQALWPDRGDSPGQRVPTRPGKAASRSIRSRSATRKTLSDGTKQFPVKLTLKKDKSTQEVRYVVNGRDPVWVFSEADYKRMIDMGNGPETGKGNSKAGRPGDGRPPIAIPGFTSEGMSCAVGGAVLHRPMLRRFRCPSFTAPGFAMAGNPPRQPDASGDGSGPPSGWPRFGCESRSCW